MKLLYLCFVAVVFSGCKKDDREINASKITMTDAFGSQIAAPDDTDWKFNDTWNQKESNLFKLRGAGYAGMQIATEFLAIGYPNPTRDVISFMFRTNKPTLVQWIITDEKLNVINGSELPLTDVLGAFVYKAFSVDIQGAEFKSNSYYRIYYALFSDGGVMYAKGHGDFKKL